MPTTTAVKEFASAWTQKWHDVFQIRCRARRRSEGCRIQEAASASENGEADEPTPDFEPAGVDVTVWQTITREVEDRAQNNRGEPGPARGAGRCTRRDVERDNHVYQY